MPPGVFIVNSEHISHLVPCVSIANFEQVNADWDIATFKAPYIKIGRCN